MGISLGHKHWECDKLKRSYNLHSRSYRRPYRRNRYDHKSPFRFIKGLWLVILCLIALAAYALVAYFVLTAVLEKDLWYAFVISLCMFYWGYNIFFDHHGTWEWVNRWAILIRHSQYDKEMTPFKRKIDDISAIAMMGISGIEIIYSIIKLIIFYI